MFLSFNMPSPLRAALALVTLLFFMGCSSGDDKTGDKLLAQKQYGAAIQAYTQYLNLHPNTAEILFKRGWAYQQADKDHEALQDFLAAIAQNPKEAKYHLAASMSYFQKKNYQQCAFEADKALEITPRDPQGHVIKGKALYHSSRFQEALDALNQALQINGELGDALLYRGLAKSKYKHPKTGCPDIKKAVSLKVPGADKAMATFCN